MGFQTPLHKLSDYLAWTTSGKIQLPDFQRGYKWEDERIRQLLVTILRGHPLGVVMLLETGNDQIRFKPRPIEGCELATGCEPDWLLLDGQQRLTSLTQALTAEGVVATEDARGKKLTRRYYIHMKTALVGDDRIDDAVISVPGDGVVRTNFGKDVELDLSDADKERAEGYFPVRLLFGGAETVTWLFAIEDKEQASRFHERVIQPASTYNIPAIQLDKSTGKGAVATVFEKVNTGGLSLNVFELLTATFAGDKTHYDKTGKDFRLNDDWAATQVPRWAKAADTARSSWPRTVEDATFVESRLHSLRTRNSAAYKGIYALLMGQNTKDWLLNQPFDKADFLKMQVDIHHIFPRAWCIKNDVDPELRESIVNKTPVAKNTNIRLGGHAPSVYLKRLESAAGLPSEELAEIIGAHQVDVAKLRADDFIGFFLARRAALATLIGQAMGKPVVHDLSGDFGGGTESGDAFEPQPDDPEGEVVRDDLGGELV